MKTGKWTEEEEQFLKDNVTKLSMKELMIALNRSEGSIRQKKSALGITSGKNKYFTDKEKEIIKEWYERFGDEIDLDELSKFLGRPKTSICRFARKCGLTDQSRMSTKNKEKARKALLDYINSPEFQKSSAKGREMFIWRAKNDHFRGMLGKHHTDEVKHKISQSHKIKWNNKSDDEKAEIINRISNYRRKNRVYTIAENAYSRCKGGFREDLNQYFRSRWEANIARYLSFLNIKWEYEKHRFSFNEIKSGILSYMPDFYLPELDVWIEVKGWMNEVSKLRLKYFEQFYSDEFKKLILVDDKKYYEIEKDFKYVVPNWENKQTYKKTS